MLLDPIPSEQECIRELVLFLLRQQHKDGDYALWSEDVNTPSVGAPIVLSIWASSNIIRSLALACDHLPSDDVSKAKESIDAAVRSLAELKQRMNSYGEQQLERDLRLMNGDPDPERVLELLDEILRERSGYCGFPRAAWCNPKQQGGGGGNGVRATPTWGMGSTIVSSDVLLTLSMLPTQCGPLETWLSVYRRDLKDIDLGAERKYVREAHDRLVASKYRPAARDKRLDQLARILPSGSKLKLAKIDLAADHQHFKAHGQLIRDLYGSKISSNGEVGWCAIPLHSGEIDLVSTLAAIEALVGCSEPEVVERDILQISKAISNRMPKDPSMGLEARQILSLESALRAINSERVYRTITPLFLESASRLASTVRDRYVEYGFVPHEVAPTPVMVGNELTHWPGVDLGLITYALQRAFSLISEKGETISKFIQERDHDHLQKFARAMHWGDYPARISPHDVPLLRHLVSAIRRQLLIHTRTTSQSESRGAFASSLWLWNQPRERESKPIIYTWSASHALMSLVFWKQQSSESNTLVGDKAASALSRFRSAASTPPGVITGVFLLLPLVAPLIMGLVVNLWGLKDFYITAHEWLFSISGLVALALLVPAMFGWLHYSRLLRYRSIAFWMIVWRYNEEPLSQWPELIILARLLIWFPLLAGGLGIAAFAVPTELSERGFVNWILGAPLAAPVAFLIYAIKAWGESKIDNWRSQLRKAKIALILLGAAATSNGNDGDKLERLARAESPLASKG